MDHELCEFGLDSGHLFSMFMYCIEYSNSYIPNLFRELCKLCVLFAQRQCAFVNKIYIFMYVHGQNLMCA